MLMQSYNLLKGFNNPEVQCEFPNKFFFFFFSRPRIFLLFEAIFL